MKNMNLKDKMVSVKTAGLCALLLAGQPAWSGTGKDEVIRHNSVSVMLGAPKGGIQQDDFRAVCRAFR